MLMEELSVTIPKINHSQSLLLSIFSATKLNYLGNKYSGLYGCRYKILDVKYAMKISKELILIYVFFIRNHLNLKVLKEYMNAVNNQQSDFKIVTKS